MTRNFYSNLFTRKEDIELIHDKSLYLLANKGI